ncbi:hypothetical protein ACS0TY_012590 [Phlomoides rotata]
MAITACFMIVSKYDIPIYEAEVGNVPKKEDAAHQHQFILRAALDIVQDMAWTTSAMFQRAIDRFNDLVVSVYVTAGHILSFVLTISCSLVEILWKRLKNWQYFRRKLKSRLFLSKVMEFNTIVKSFTV